MSRRQHFLQAHAADPGHADIQHQATGTVGRTGLEEALRAVETLGPQPGGFQQQLQGVAHGRIVVDQENGGAGIHALSLTRSAGG